MARDEIEVLADVEALARAAAEHFRVSAERAVAERGRFVVALSGGSTPRSLYRLLASGDVPDLPWERTWVLFGDERCVPPGHPDSNYGMARRELLDRVPVARERVLRMEGEREPREAAERYEGELRGIFAGEGGPRSDLVLLGVGDDGHTASLFPGTAALEETRRWVVANHVPRLSAWRLTLTLPALIAARAVLFLIAGASKAAIVAEAFGGKPHPAPHPCELVMPRDGSRIVLCDRAAAAGID